MCDCMNEMIYNLKSMNENVDYIFPPVDMLSGRAYITVISKEKGKKKQNKIHVLLSKCPICGNKYEEKEEKH